MSLLRFLLRSSRGVVLVSILAGAVSGASSVGLIAVIHRELATPRPSGWTLALTFGALCLLAQVTRVIAQASMIRLAQGSVARMGLHLARRILAVPLQSFEELDPAALLAVLTEDIAIVTSALAGIPVIAITAPIVVACLGYVGWLSPVALACGLGVAVPAILLFQAVASLAVGSLRRARAGHDVMVESFRTLIGGFRELKVHRGRRAAFLEAAAEAAATIRDQSTRGLTLFAAAGSVNQFAYFGVIGFLLFVLPAIHPIDRETLGGVLLAVLYVMSPLEVIMNWVPVLGRARVSLGRIEALDPSLLAVEAAEEVGAGPRLTSEIAFEGIRFAYPRGLDRDDFVLGPLDLTLRPEEVVFLVGGNGSGKTTLVKLLTGLYSPQAGAVRLDGRLVSPAALDDYRQLFSVVFADGHLFSTLMGLDDPGLDDDARDGLARLELDHLVRVERGAFSTTDLSQGQRRRLALLIACLEDRPVYVLDEWAANQDARFKDVFYREILPGLRARGKCVVVITHDEDYFHAADRVIRLDAGRVLEGDADPLPGRARH